MRGHVLSRPCEGLFATKSQFSTAIIKWQPLFRPRPAQCFPQGGCVRRRNMRFKPPACRLYHAIDYIDRMAEETTSHVIVIGAGAAGLTAARLLRSKRVNVTVLEARDRIGGRIHTFTNGFSKPVEAGAEFIHGRQPLTFALADEAGAARYLLKGSQASIENGGVQKGDLLDDHWKALVRALDNLAADTDMASFLDRYFPGPEHEALRHTVQRYVEGYDVADLDRVSAKSIRKEWKETDDAHQYRFEPGYGALMDFLAQQVQAAGGNIYLAMPVTEIHWQRGSVRVTTAGGKVIEGDRVVVTVPLGVLQSDSIRFDPPLPDHTRAVRAMGYGGVIKFIVEFHEPFWKLCPRATLHNPGFIFSDAPVPTWWSRLPDETPMLTGWLGGPPARNTHHQREALWRQATASLQYIFQCSLHDINIHCRHFHIADWTTDEFSRGAYSYPTVAGEQAKSVLAKPVEETVYFSGEAIYNGPAIGTVEAALAAGGHTARELLRSIVPG